MRFDTWAALTLCSGVMTGQGVSYFRKGRWWMTVGDLKLLLGGLRDDLELEYWLDDIEGGDYQPLDASKMRAIHQFGKDLPLQEMERKEV